MQNKFAQAKEDVAKLEAEKEEKQKAISEKVEEIEVLKADVADRQLQYESMKRQCDTHAEEAKSSKEISDKHFLRMKELEDELLQEKMLRCQFQEAVEQNQKSDLLMGITTSESLLDKLKRLEQEKNDLLRERELYMLNENNNNIEDGDHHQIHSNSNNGDNDDDQNPL